MTNSWPLVKLKDILDGAPRNGTSPSASGTIEERVLTLSSITGARFDATVSRVARFKTSPPKSHRVSSSDLLICRGNGNLNLVGRGFFPNEDRPDLIFPDTVIAARITATEVHPTYLEYVWNSPIVRAQIERQARTTNGTYKINQEILRDIAFPMPPMAWQRRIAEVLDQADELRAKRRQAIALLNDLTQSVFLDMFGDPASNPKGWTVVPLGEVGNIQSGLQVTSKRKSLPIEVPYLRVANAYRNRLDLQEIKTIKVTERELERTALELNDLLIVEGHGNANEIGRAALWDGSISPCVHQNHLIRVRLGEKALPGYVVALLNTIGGRLHLLRSANTTSGLNTISTSDVRTTPVMLPPLENQFEYVKRTTRVYQMQADMKTAFYKLDELFASLQVRAFRGEL